MGPASQLLPVKIPAPDPAPSARGPCVRVAGTGYILGIGYWCRLEVQKALKTKKISLYALIYGLLNEKQTHN